MRSLKEKFNETIEKHPFWSTYISFAVSITGQNYPKEMVRKWFTKLVDRDDYALEEKRQIFLSVLTLLKKEEKIPP